MRRFLARAHMLVVWRHTHPHNLGKRGDGPCLCYDGQPVGGGGRTNVWLRVHCRLDYGTLGPSCSQEVDAIEKEESELKLFENDLYRLENRNSASWQSHASPPWKLLAWSSNLEKSHL